MVPIGAPGCPEPSTLAPCAAAINCRSFCGSLSHCLNSGPMDWAASWAAIESSPVVGSAAMNLTSLMRIEELLSPSVSLICFAKSCALEPPIAKALTSRLKSSSVTLFENRMLERPAAFSNCAKLRSAWPVSSGMPSSRSLSSETPSTKPVSLRFGERVLQLFPCSLKLAVSALVVGSIQPRVLNEDIETVEERPRRRATSCIGLNGVLNGILLEREHAISVCRKVTLCTITRGNWTTRSGLRRAYRHRQDMPGWVPGALH